MAFERTCTVMRWFSIGTLALMAVLVSGCRGAPAPAATDASVVPPVDDAGMRPLGDAGPRADSGACVPTSCEALAVRCARVLDGCGNVLTCDGCGGRAFDPRGDRHLELPPVIAGAPFELPIRVALMSTAMDLVRRAGDGSSTEAAPSAIGLPGLDAIESQLTYDSASGLLRGRIVAAGVHRFRVAVCAVPSLSLADCPADSRRLDLAHLTVLPAEGAPSPPLDDPRRYPTGSFDVALDVQRVNANLLATDGPRYEESRDPSFPPYATTTSTRVFFPAEAEGSERLAAGTFPVVALAHGNGYRPDEYDGLGAALAARGIVLIVPQFPFVLGPCDTSLARAGYAETAWRWLLDESERPGSALEGHIDPERIVVAGHSWGGAAIESTLHATGARFAVIIDPVSVLQNISEWTGCVGLPDGAPRVGNLPVLLFDAVESGYSWTRVGYRGWYASSARAHVALAAAAHEDFLDPDAPMARRPAAAPAVHQATALLLARWMARFADDDVRWERRAVGPEAREIPAELLPDGAQIAVSRPRAGDLGTLDDAALAPVGPWPATADNALGGSRTTVDALGETARWPALVDVFLTTAFPGEYTARNERFFGAPVFREHRVRGPGAVIETLPAGSVPDGARFLAFDLGATDAGPLALSLELRVDEGTVVRVEGRAADVSDLPTQRERPRTLYVELARFGVDPARLVEVRLVLGRETTYLLDDMRFE